MIQDILIGAPVAVNVFCSFLDSDISQEGYAKGYNESNSILTLLFGNKPKSYQLYIYNLFWVTLFASAQIFGRNNPAVFGFGTGAQILNGLTHVRSYFTWKNAIATNGTSLTAPKTMWEKLLW